MTHADELLHHVRIAAGAADDKKAAETLIIDVGDVFSVSDYFVVTSGSNPRQVAAIVDAVEEEIKNVGGPGPVRVEGLEDRVGPDGLRGVRHSCVQPGTTRLLST